MVGTAFYYNSECGDYGRYIYEKQQQLRLPPAAILAAVGALQQHPATAAATTTAAVLEAIGVLRLRPTAATAVAAAHTAGTAAASTTTIHLAFSLTPTEAPQVQGGVDLPYVA